MLVLSMALGVTLLGPGQRASALDGSAEPSGPTRNGSAEPPSSAHNGSAEPAGAAHNGSAEPPGPAHNGSAEPPQATTAAAAASSGIVVPQRLTSEFSLSVLGATTDSLAVSQNSGHQRVLLGRTGSPLSPTGLGTADAGYALFDDALTWWTSVSHEDETTAWTVHRLNRTTGEQTRYDSPAEPVAMLPDGWLSAGGGALVRHGFNAGAATLITGIAVGNYASVAVQADATGAVISYVSAGNSEHRARVGLITFDRPGIDILTSPDPDEDYDFGLNPAVLTPHTVVWTTRPVGTKGVELIHRRSRSGGAVSTIPAPVGDRQLFTATDDRMALVTADEVPTLRVRDDGAWRTVRLPTTPGADLKPAGDTFYLGNGTGVYAIGTGPATRVATAPPMPQAAESLSLSAGALTYTEDQSLTDVSRPVWHRSVRRSSGPVPALTLGPAGRLAARLTPERFGESPELSFSAGRGVIARENDLQLLDRGAVTRTVEWSEPSGVSSSGPYTLADGEVIDAAGRTVLAPPEESWSTALFGSTVVQCGQDGAVGLWRIPVPALSSATNGQARSGTRIGTKCTDLISIWGNTVAWKRTDGTIAVRTLASTRLRVVHPGLSHGDQVRGLRLSEGTLHWWSDSWSNTDAIDQRMLLDLSSPSSVPVPVTGMHSVTIDDHLLAGIDNDTGAVRIRLLPFGLGARHRPRLFGITAAASVVRTWSLRADVTKPVTAVRLRITRSGRLVRVLKGTGPDGSIRNLRWNGRDEHGHLVRAGTYRWRLGATAADGEGSLTAADGHSAVTGTVTLTRGAGHA